MKRCSAAKIRSPKGTTVVSDGGICTEAAVVAVVLLLQSINELSVRSDVDKEGGGGGWVYVVVVFELLRTRVCSAVRGARAELSSEAEGGAIG